MKPFPFADYLVFAIFAVAVGLTVGGALIAALSTRIIRGVSGLMICCVGLAGLYYFLNSPFLALMEILIYVGAVCVTIVFGVMLSEPDEPEVGPVSDRTSSTEATAALPSHGPVKARTHLRADHFWGAGALAVSALVFAGVAYLSLHGPWTAPAKLVSDGSVRAIGISLLTTYSLPFELISAVLLVAILGALVIARSGRTKE